MMTFNEMRDLSAQQIAEKQAEKRQRQKEARIRARERRAEKAGRTFEEQRVFECAIAKEKRDKRKAKHEAEMAAWRAQREAEIAAWEAGAEQRAIEQAKAKERRKAYEEELEAKKKEKWARINELEKVWAEDPEVLALMPNVGMKALVWWRSYIRLSREDGWMGPMLGEVVKVDETYRKAWFNVRICDDSEHEACGWDDDEYCDESSYFYTRHFVEQRVKDKIYKVWKGVGVRKPKVWRNRHLDMKKDGIIAVELILDGKK